VGRLERGDDGGDRLQDDRHLRRLPHVHPGRHERKGRPEPRPPEGGCRAGRPVSRRVRAAVDRGPRRIHCARVPEGGHVGKLLQAAHVEPGRRTRAVSGGEHEMTDVAPHADHSHAEHAHTGRPPARGWHRFTYPGWLRVLWFTPLFGTFWLGVTVLIRWAADWYPLWKSGPIVSVALVSYPLGFLLGLGGLDYWLYYMAGRPSRPDTHEGHGAKSWKDYFRINPDHKVIGVQYLCTVIFFFFVGGFFALLFRAELAHPGDQYFNPQTFNVLVSNHAALMIFLVIIPGFAALGNFVIPLMIGAADMAFPKLNALSF